MQGAAERWLARNAAGVKLIRSGTEWGRDAAVCACTGLVSCLPALEDIMLCLAGPIDTDDLGSLLEALARCPRLRALDLRVIDREVYWEDFHDDDDNMIYPSPDLSAFAKLRGLTKLALSCSDVACGETSIHPCTLAGMVGALVSLNG